MGLGMFKRHVALLKSGFWGEAGALGSPFAVIRVQHRGQSCWVVSRDSEGDESVGPEMNGQSAAIRARRQSVFKPHCFPVSTLRLQPRRTALVQRGTWGAAGSWNSPA